MSRLFMSWSRSHASVMSSKTLLKRVRLTLPAPTTIALVSKPTMILIRSFSSPLKNLEVVDTNDFTSDKSKSGTPSPWAVFDAWGAGADICPSLSPEDESKLSPESVRIPIQLEDELEEGVADTNNDETPILEAYDKFLKRRSR
jgi:hypothetical protein